jgi:hypothetical protein
VELSFKIWREIFFFRRRNICILFKELGHWVEKDGHGAEVSLFRAFMYLSNSARPTILHASHESRTGGLKNYTLDFGVENAHPRFTVSRPARTYINWKADRVCVNETNDFRSEPDLNILPHFIDLCK